MTFRKLLPTLLLAAMIPAAFVSCNPNEQPGEEQDPKENTDPQENPQEGEEDQPKVETYKFVASTLQGTWKEGDQIYVHGSLGSLSDIITLKKEDISADGKTATGSLEKSLTYAVAPDNFYAAWPDNAVKHTVKKIGTKTSFQKCDSLMTVAYLSGDTFNFVDVASSITFTLTGDFNQYALSANNRDGIIVTNFEVDHTSAKTTMTQAQNTGYPFQYGSMASGKEVTIWMPGNMTFKGGITIYFGKDDHWTASYTKNGDLTLQAAKNTALGDISASIASYSGPAPKMPKMTGTSKRLTVKCEELSGICLSEDETFMWGVGDEGDLAKIGFDGKIIGEIVHIGGDSEDVSWNRDGGNLLIGLEPDGAGVVNPPFTGRVSTIFNLSACGGYGNSGIEGLTYYKDSLFFCGAQANSHFFLCDLKTKKVLKNQQMWKKELLSEIAGMCYDKYTDWLWIIDSEAKKVFVFSAQKAYDELFTDGGDVYNALLGAYPVSDAANPESVCVDHKNSCVWVGDDYGSTSYLYKYDISGLDDFNIE